MIYLDNAATTQISEEVLDEMMPYLKDRYGNAGSVHQMGRQAFESVEIARQRVASLLDVQPAQIIFTSGGTEANNMVFQCTRDYLDGHPDIVVSAGEHDSVLRAAEKAIKCNHGHVFQISLDKYGYVDEDDFHHTIIYKGNIGLVSIMRTNNETGVINNVPYLFKMIDEYKKFHALTHSDCVQAAGTEPLGEIVKCCDFVSISSHKIHGPKGVGALYAKDKDIMKPLICGGRVQEYGIRGGTENVAGIVGFGKACELADKNLQKNIRKMYGLYNCFIETLLGALREHGLEHLFHINCFTDSVKTHSIRFDGIPSDTLLMMLDANGICVSAGSACTAHNDGLSHVLKAMGMSERDIRSSIRVSFSEMNTQREMEVAAIGIANIVCNLHKNML